MFVIDELSADTGAAWDAYIQQAPAGLPQHLAGWRHVLERNYGYKTCYLLARPKPVTGSSAIAGVLPLFFVRSPLLGSRAMTMPGGLCADNPETAQALLHQAQVVAQQAGVKQFLLQDTRQAWPGDWQTTQAHVAWHLDLHAGATQLWERLDRNIRRQVRMARENQLQVVIERAPRLLGDFYQVFSRFTHQAGTPIFARRFLEEIVEQFPTGYNILLVYQAGAPIAGYFQLEMGHTMYGVWGAALPEALKLRPVYLAYWELLANACAHNFVRLDMGRSPLNSNAAAFKAQWGGDSAPVYQQIKTEDRHPSASVVSTRSKTNRTFQLFQQIWPKLPFSLVQYLGPQLRRHIPFA